VVVVPGPGVSPPQQIALDRPRILVVDGQPLFVVVLSHLLAGPALRARTLAAETTESALEILSRESVDVVLCDVRVSPLSFREFLAEVGALPEPPPVVLLADVQDEGLLLAAIETRAAGFFTKDAEPTQFLEGIRSVLQGHRAVGANVMRLLVARLSGEDSASARPGLGRLSRTEIDILTMVGAARSVQSIAAARGISQKTVRNHLANIYRKLELRSRTEAMLCAARMGLTAD
jgi:DNA-binding NarL/FixJ family response regulator